MTQDGASIRDTRARWIALTIVFFVAFIFFAGSAADRPARVRVGVPLIAIALACLARFFWIYFELAKRRSVDWYYRRYTGPWVLRLAYPLAGASIAFALLAIGMMAAWLTTL